jgi:hypothetical protein
MSADSETASYTSATALSDNERQPCPIAGGCMTVAVAGLTAWARALAARIERHSGEIPDEHLAPQLVE